MKTFLSKCFKFVSAPFFCISKSFSYFCQKKIVHNINVFKTDKEVYLFWPIVDLSQILILLYTENKRSGVADFAPLVSTILIMVQIFFIFGRFSSSMSWIVLQILRKLTGLDCLKIAGNC